MLKLWKSYPQEHFQKHLKQLRRLRMLKPVEDKVIVKVDEEENVSSSGLFLAPTGEKQDTAIVVAVGPGLLLGNGQMMIPEVEVGNKVIFAKYQGTEVEHDGQTYLILAYRDILAVLG
jgi:chaperonin GroES